MANTTDKKHEKVHVLLSNLLNIGHNLLKKHFWY